MDDSQPVLRPITLARSGRRWVAGLRPRRPMARVRLLRSPTLQTADRGRIDRQPGSLSRISRLQRRLLLLRSKILRLAPNLVTIVGHRTHQPSPGHSIERGRRPHPEAKVWRPVISPPASRTVLNVARSIVQSNHRVLVFQHSRVESTPRTELEKTAIGLPGPRGRAGNDAIAARPVHTSGESGAQALAERGVGELPMLAHTPSDALRAPAAVTPHVNAPDIEELTARVLGRIEWLATAQRERMGRI